MHGYIFLITYIRQIQTYAHVLQLLTDLLLLTIAKPFPTIHVLGEKCITGEVICVPSKSLMISKGQSACVNRRTVVYVRTF